MFITYNIYLNLREWYFILLLKYIFYVKQSLIWINLLKINELNIVGTVFNRINLAIVEFFDSKSDASVDFSNFGYITTPQKRGFFMSKKCFTLGYELE